MSMNEELREAEARLAQAGVDTARLEAQLLLGMALGVSRTAIVAGLYAAPTETQRQTFASLVAKRMARVPLAYLRGTQEFYGLTFVVSPAVLIPRPETELLVDFAQEKLEDEETTNRLAETSRHEVKKLPDTSPSPMSFLRFADVGTGSGCIAVSILAHAPNVQGVAIDVSRTALAVAGENGRRNGVSKRMRRIRGNLLDGLDCESLDLVVSNPPYIPSQEVNNLQAEVRDWEPRLALDGGADGLALVRCLTTGAQRALRSGGWLAVEIAQGQDTATAAIFDTAGLTNIEVRPDLAGIGRIVCGQKPA